MGWHLRVLIAAACAVALIPTEGVAQGSPRPRWEIPGLDFHPDGVWRAVGHRVRQYRRALLSRGDFASLNAPALRTGAPALALPAAVSGTIRMPALLFSYPGVDSAAAMRDPAQYQTLLFAPTAPPGLPYSHRSFYGELSNGLLDVDGDALGWVRLDNAESTYTGGQDCSGNPLPGSTNCNGIWSGFAFVAMQAGLREALTKADPSVDFGQYDNDGPDGVPNSPDDDGYVDVIAFLHATRDGACGGTSNNHLWSHRATLAYTTDDPSARGGMVRVRDYILQSGLGGVTACDSTQLMAIGTLAHEFGHGLGLPDLYDTSGDTEGIGQWGLMGSGNYASPRSPARMEAWSMIELGWIAVRPLTTAGSYTLGPVPTADTAVLVRVPGDNPRGEYFLLENRQAVQSDSALIRIHCHVSNDPPGCGGGLLIWHIDSIKANQAGGVNVGTVHGVALEQADGLRQLDLASGGNRGDAGDPYPGVTGNPAFSVGTNPAATKNADGAFAGLAIDSIRALAFNGAMAFRLRFGGATLVRASDTAAVVIVRTDTLAVFRDLVADGEVVPVAVPDTQLAADGRTRWQFVSWSDGQPRVHDLVGSLAGDTVVATLARDFRLSVTVQGAGSVTATPDVDLAGTLLAEGTPVSLMAEPDSGWVFGSWTQDTIATGPALTLMLGRPYDLVARFDPPLAIGAAPIRPPAVMGAPYADTLGVVGGSGVMTWTVVVGVLPPGLALHQTSGAITGIATATGTYQFTAEVVSGSQRAEAAFSLSVVAPTLATDAVVAQLLGGTGGLTVDELRYLDLLGNRNGFFDVGDFKAWVDATGAPPSAPPAARQRSIP